MYSTDCVHEREQAVEDRLFYSTTGSQWSGPFSQQFENKPKIEVNKILLAMTRLQNEYRNNRITVDFVTKDGTTDDKLADTCDRLYRADEQDSSAQEAYDNAFEEASGGGMGGFRYRTEYEDEYDDENDKQRIRIEPIYDADTSIYFDGNAKKYDKSDSNYCYLLTGWTREAYEEEWGEDISSWQKNVDDLFDWYTKDVVYVAEYYKIEDVNESIFTYVDINGKEEKYNQTDLDSNEELEERLTTQGYALIRQRKIKRRAVHKYIMSGDRVLEDCGIIAGKHIPIVPVYGKRWYINNIERFMGLVRPCKDAQRLYNMQISKLAEISALSTVEKPIVTPEQITGHENAWASDNINNAAYLPINPVRDALGSETPMGPVGYTKVPNIPPAMAALLQGTSADIKELLGNPENGEKIQANSSGKAIELVQSQIDFHSFIYMDNMSKSIKRGGEIWLSMAREIYVEDGRKMKGVGSQDELSSIELQRPSIDKETGETVYENDITKATFDVAVDVGPSFMSRRNATIKNLTSVMQFTTDPQDQKILSSLVMMNMEGEGLNEVKGYYRKQMIQLGVTEPTEEERKKLEESQANQKPDANAQFLEAAAQKEEAQAAEARMDTIKTMKEAEKVEAETVETQANTVKILSDIDISKRQAAIDSVQMLDTV
jgi:hypothetical protein